MIIIAYNKYWLSHTAAVINTSSYALFEEQCVHSKWQEYPKNKYVFPPGTPMALKVMPKASTKLQGFLREYCISLHLSCHPCIVGLFGIAFHSEEHYCFAQELVIGKDLFAVIKPKVNQKDWETKYMRNAEE